MCSRCVDFENRLYCINEANQEIKGESYQFISLFITSFPFLSSFLPICFSLLGLQLKIPQMGGSIQDSSVLQLGFS